MKRGDTVNGRHPKGTSAQRADSLRDGLARNTERARRSRYLRLYDALRQQVQSGIEIFFLHAIREAFPDVPPEQLDDDVMFFALRQPPILHAHFTFERDGVETFEVTLRDIRTAEETGTLVDPNSGAGLTDWEDNLYPWFTPTEQFITEAKS